MMMLKSLKKPEEYDPKKNNEMLERIRILENKINIALSEIKKSNQQFDRLKRALNIETQQIRVLTAEIVQIRSSLSRKK